MGRPLLTSIPHTSRALYHLRYRVAFVLFILALFQQQHLYLVHRQSLAAKYSPTKLSFDSEDAHPQIWRPDDEVSQLQDELIANRASWKVLGQGWEGKVFAYKDSVIKTFTTGRSPFRNCVPGAMSDKWPTEIPASLHFGGPFKHAKTSHHDSFHDANIASDGFLPVKAYFMASVSPSDPPEWHLVTPLLKGGNLNTLADELSKDVQAKSFRQIDALYRPAFNQLLKSMEDLHDAGYCHDDIKPANVFIQDELHWVLGDLGNLRHVFHPYHSSRLWRDNEQLEDCRANDVVRLLKSYLQFVRSSVADAGEFNTAFYEGQEPMSRLFWWTLAEAQSMSATELRRRSIIEYPEAHRNASIDERFPITALHLTLRGLFSQRLALKHAVDHALVTRMGEKMARWWAMVWLFGVPVSESCSV